MSCLLLMNFTSIAGCFSKKQYATIVNNELAIKLQKERCLKCLSVQCSSIRHWPSQSMLFFWAESCQLCSSGSFPYYNTWNIQVGNFFTFIIIFQFEAGKFFQIKIYNIHLLFLLLGLINLPSKLKSKIA